MVDKSHFLWYHPRMKRYVKHFLIAFIALWAIAAYDVVTSHNKTASTPNPNTTVGAVQRIPELKSNVTPDQLYKDINDVRVKEGLKPYNRNALLDKSAKMKCDDMVRENYSGHENPKTGKRGYSYVTDVGLAYSEVSENLAKGSYIKADAIVGIWMLSDSHRESILRPEMSQIGFAVCSKSDNPRELYVVQHKIEPAPSVKNQAPLQQNSKVNYNPKCVELMDAYKKVQDKPWPRYNPDSHTRAEFNVIVEHENNIVRFAYNAALSVSPPCDKPLPPIYIPYI